MVTGKPALAEGWETRRSDRRGILRFAQDDVVVDVQYVVDRNRRKSAL